MKKVLMIACALLAAAGCVGCCIRPLCSTAPAGPGALSAPSTSVVPAPTR